ncbi:MAG: 3-keto-disaccharide hydrolase [Telluria sp.]
MVKTSLLGGMLATSLVLAGCAAPGPQPFDSAAGLELVAAPAADLAAAWSRGLDGVIRVGGTPAGYIATRASYTNYRLHVEWRWPDKPGNAGVLLHVASGPKDGAWPLSVQVQTKHGFAGDLLPMAGASFAEALSTAPGAYPAIKGHTGAASERPAGEWNSADILSRDGVIEVSINGVPQNRVSGAAPRAGRIGFQLEGAAYELRNIRVTPLP